MDVKQAARRAVEGSAVLLKNQGNLLPFASGKTLALFGWAQVDSVLSGNGSGAARGGKAPSIAQALGEAGFGLVEPLAAFYRQAVEEDKKAHPPEFDASQIKEAVNSGLMYEIFGKYTPNPQEFSIPAGLLEEAASQTDTALWVVGRKSGGEECDRHLENDYYLSQQEQALLEQLCAAFPKVAVVLNINGLMDLSWIEDHPQIQAVLFLGVPGEEGPAALAELLLGKVTPSGKLSVTIAKDGEDYPAWKDFSWDKDHPDSILTYQDYGLTPPDVQGNSPAGPSPPIGRTSTWATGILTRLTSSLCTPLALGCPIRNFPSPPWE